MTTSKFKLPMNLKNNEKCMSIRQLLTCLTVNHHTVGPSSYSPFSRMFSISRFSVSSVDRCEIESNLMPVDIMDRYNVCDKNICNHVTVSQAIYLSLWLCNCFLTSTSRRIVERTTSKNVENALKRTLPDR